MAVQMHAKHGDIPALTGLRGVAALLVVVGHFSLWTAVTPLAEVPAGLRHWAGMAPGIGMSIFFTLSGYVIALNYNGWNWRGRPAFSFVRLFFYRFARLYPAFFVFAIVIVLRSPMLRDLTDPQAQAYLVPHLLLLQSWLPVKYAGADASSGLFHVSWSISTECGLYVLFGLGAIVAAAFPPWRHKILIVGAAFSAIVIALLVTAWLMRAAVKPTDWSDADWAGWLFYLAPWGISVQFGIGVLAWRFSTLVSPERFATVASNLGAAGLVIVYLLCGAGIIREQITQGLLSALSTAFLMAGGLSASSTNRLLSRPGIVYVGAISYSLYLFHFLAPTIAFHGQRPTWDLTAAVYYATNFMVSVALAIMLATGIYRLVEVPGRRAIRAAADRLLGIRSKAQVMDAQAVHAE
jgi:peptidoglycan/LPS O-acetylase OafA/YrhL